MDQGPRLPRLAADARQGTQAARRGDRQHARSHARPGDDDRPGPWAGGLHAEAAHPHGARSPRVDRSGGRDRGVDADGQSTSQRRGLPHVGRGRPQRCDRQDQVGACVVEPADLAARRRPPRRRRPGAGRVELGPLAGSLPDPAVQGGRLSSVQMARLVRLRRRGARRHGLPHHRSGRLVAQARSAGRRLV